MAGLSYDEDVSAASLCSSILSLMKSRSLLIGVNAAHFSLFQDAAIANLIDARKNDITEAGSGDFIGTVLQLLEKDVSDLEKEAPYAGEVLALISRVKNETEGE